MRWLLLCFFLGACTHSSVHQRSALEISKAKKFASGYLAIVQGPTSENETNINVMSPRLKDYRYQVTDDQGKTYAVEKYETVKEPQAFYKIDKLYVTGLQPKAIYTLSVIDEFRAKKYQIDERTFQTLDLKKNDVQFAMLSCMADDYRFNEVIDQMWARLEKAHAELLVFNGDTVYVDSFEFVERGKANHLDIWQRYIDSFKRLPVYHWRRLTPILATWDDHDFGTNDSDRTFIGKNTSLVVFRAFFGGRNIPGIWETGPSGVSSRFFGFHQRFYFMDDRILRQPNKKQKTQEEFGHWGQVQHQWLTEDLRRNTTPSWIFNGNQLFSGQFLEYKETFADNHPAHFRRFIEDLKTIPAPVIFSSGDIHLSEIMKIPAALLGYQTYELTSSSMHSYTGEGWDNPARLPGMITNEFNFLLVSSKAEGGTLNVSVQALGRAREPYFQTTLQVKR
jgi:alkaline phosphatase D